MQEKASTNVAQLVKEGVKEIVIRHGEALELTAPKVIDLKGNINAPGEFIGKRKEGYPKENVHVIFNKDTGTILLIVDDKNEYAGTIEGKLLMNKELEEFYINHENKRFDSKSLLKLIKFKKHLFPDGSEQSKLLERLMSFKAQLSAEFENSNDNKGNKNFVAKSNVTTNIDLNFTLETEVYKGFPKKKFKVEVCMDARSADSVDFWLESVELANLINSEKEAIFESKKEDFKEYTIIEQ